MGEEAAEAEKAETPCEAAVATNGKAATAESPAVDKEEDAEADDADEDPSTRQIRVALEALRARRAELREANAEIDVLREQLLKAQGDAEAEVESKEFMRSERDLLEKAKAAYAADLDVLKNQLGAARATIEEERASVKKVQGELAEEKKARSALSSDILRLQSQLGSFSEGLKKLQGRFSVQTADLEVTNKAKAALLSELETLKPRLEQFSALEAQLSTGKLELETTRTLYASLQQELEDQRKAADSSADVARALQAQLQNAQDQLGQDQEARLLLLGNLRAELEAKMQGAFREICQDLDQAPHRMLCTGPSAMRQRRPARSVAAGVPAGRRISFHTDETLVARIAVTSYRDLKSDLWDTDPEGNAECTRCETRTTKDLGFMKKLQGRSEQARQDFLCAECNRMDAVENKRREELKARNEVADKKRNEEMKSFFPMSSPPRQASNGTSAQQVDSGSGSGSESYSESDSSPPDSVPDSESSGGARGRGVGGKLRRAHCGHDRELGRRAKRRKG